LVKPLKTIVFLLVLANVMFYAFTEGYLGRPEHPDSGRVAQQVTPERMRIVSRGEVPAAQVPTALVVEPVVEPAPAKPAESSVEMKEVVKPVAEPLVVESKKPAVEANVCLVWEQLSVVDAERINGVLAGKFSNYKVSRQVAGGEGNGWWVYIPPLAGKPEADKKASELKGFGVTDYFIIPDGPNRFAISLGIFTAEKGGQERLAELKDKGVRSARLTPRPGKDGTVSLEASGPQSTRDALLKAVGKPQAKVSESACK
jgi:hypothetical protein